MNLDEALKKRRSIRHYLDIPVEKDKWTEIIEAGNCAPSSGNIRNWKIVIVQENDTKEKISDMCHNQSWIANAPIIFVLCADNKIANQYYGKRGEMLYSIQNLSAMCQNMMLKAVDLGLGTCWISAFDEERIKVLLGIPGHVRPQAILTIGYPNERAPEPPRTDLHDFCFFDVYGKRWSKVGAALRHWEFAKARENISKGGKQFFKDIFKKKSQERKEHKPTEGKK